MKSTSTEALFLGRAEEQSPTGTGRVRPARMDQPLSPGLVNPFYADETLEQVIAETRQKAIASGQAEGYARGLAAGNREARRRAETETERLQQQHAQRALAFADSAASALAALTSAAQTLQAATAVHWEAVGRELVDGALTLARSILARELTSVDAEVVEALQAALRVSTGKDLEVRVHPEDFDVLDMLPDDRRPVGVRLVADPQVPRAGAMAVSGFEQVLAHFPSAITAAEEVLRP